MGCFCGSSVSHGNSVFLMVFANASFLFLIFSALEFSVFPCSSGGLALPFKRPRLPRLPSLPRLVSRDCVAASSALFRISSGFGIL